MRGITTLLSWKRKVLPQMEAKTLSSRAPIKGHFLSLTLPSQPFFLHKKGGGVVQLRREKEERAGEE